MDETLTIATFVEIVRLAHQSGIRQENQAHVPGLANPSLS
jgi:hypothetical protein